MTRLLALAFLAAFAAPALAAGAGTYTPQLVMLGPVPLDFVLFAAVLLCVALFHHDTFQVAVTGVIVVSAYKILFTGLKTGPGLAGFAAHLGHEWVLLANLFCLLMGFALLSKHFEDSNVPAALPKCAKRAGVPRRWPDGLARTCHRLRCPSAGPCGDQPGTGQNG